MKTAPLYIRYGEHAALVRWEAVIDPMIHHEVLRLRHFISEKFSEEIIETVPAYHELALYFKPNVSVSEVLKKIKRGYKIYSEHPSEVNFNVKIPVCYDEKFALDMERVVTHTGLSKAEIIAKHTETTYKVYFLGFLPGFPYLGGLDTHLATPRLESPREYIEKGAVAIGGNQTGIYPSASPGGWNIIGQTPLQMFDLQGSQITILRSGDFVQFVAISAQEFIWIEEKVASNSYIIEKEVRHD